MNPRILLIEDDEGSRFGFVRFLSKAGYSVREAASLSQAREAALSQRFDAVLLDLNLPDGNGLDWIIELRDNYPDVSVIVITGYGDIPVAVEAMRRGADNFLTKPVNMADLDVFLRKSLELGILRRKCMAIQRLERKGHIFFGESEAMKKVMDLASLAAKTDAPVLLLGETGSGKGVLAKWLHENSSRSSSPFVEVNCSNLKGDLLASELFGHAKGAFTTAVQDRQGLVEVADGGTLFLDEISDMDIGVQAQFLKVIEDRQYRRLGEVKTRRSDFRIVCATNRDLLDETRNGLFRKDLYFRINVLSIVIPSLRERPEDIEGLTRSILKGFGRADATVSPEIMGMLHGYSWPGNIRELGNVLERAILLARGQALVPEYFAGLTSSQILVNPERGLKALEDNEYDHIQAVMERFGGNTRRAAQSLNISRATLYRKLKKFRGKQ